MKYILAIWACCLLSITCKAQYTTQGKIEFERKMNLHRRMDDADEHTKQWIDKMRSQIPKFSSSFFDLSFTTNSSIYQPGRESESKTNFWFLQIPAGDNTVYTDFKKQSVTAAKNIFEEKFLIEDSVRKIKWRIRDEIRTIAGYSCRKAVGIICDSVYVVAFYTDDIMVSGGPEMFGGLPGMILEIAIPRLHTTWIATKVNTELLAETNFTVPTKGKKVKPEELEKTIGNSLKRWGKDNAQRMVWWSTL